MGKLFILLSLFVLVLIFPKMIFGQTQKTASGSAVIKYDLAYPGILADNPFYKFKVLRNKIIASLINDPRRKIEFYLLEADKGILATAILVDKNKINLAENTALKGENNMTLLTYELYKLKQKPSPDFIQKLKTASLKHQEVLNSLINRLSQDKQATLISVLNFSKTNLQTIERFEKKKFDN